VKRIHAEKNRTVWRPVREGPPPPDQPARDRIVEELDVSLLVEAGAGSGKTTALLERMVALVATGTATIDEIAAVTFTRKAAAELAERFQIAIEEALRRCRATGDDELVERLDRALRQRDRGFVGTIHAFCGRLLRERPVVAGLDPAFRELVGPELEEHRRRFWDRWIDQAYGEPDPALAALGGVGLSPEDLVDAFRKVDDNPDVEFPAEAVGRPDAGPIRAAIEPLLDEAVAMLPRQEPLSGWDKLQKIVRRLRWLRRSPEWLDDAAFFDAVAPLAGWDGKIVQVRWGDDAPSKANARILAHKLGVFAQRGGPAANAVDRWYAHRYPIALDFVRRAAAGYAEERRRTGRLTFNDLLILAARLLRESPSARADLARRWRWLLVDEFQDTDPIQAEIVFLLTADDPAEGDWTRATPRPGSLFVVGDPKQSIYRFRRADIAVYRTVRQRFDTLAREPGPAGRPLGGVVTLDANFRSRPSIERFVDDEFGHRFPEDATEVQAAFAPLRVQKGAAGRGETEGVWCYEIQPQNVRRHAAVAAEDAGRVAAWIDARIRAGERKAGDFLVLPYHRKFLAAYAEALEARNIPVQVTGAELVIEEELKELRLLLEALADPSDPSLAVAVLVGLFFGLDYESLTDYALDEGSFRIVIPPPEGAEGPVVEAMERLRGWWRLVRSTPADVSVPTIIEELGLVPYAAASGLGAARAGAIGYVLEVIRKIGIEGDTSLRGAIEAIEVALQLGEAEAPLEPLREDAVRIMNLHKAKGTEAPVVVLAAPTGVREFPIDLRVERGARAGSAGEVGAIGWLEIRSKRRSRFAPPVVARPLEWDRHAAEENRFKDAERDRLLYVAATRAKDELLVGRCRACEKESFWQPLYACLERSWPPHELMGAAPGERRRLERPVEEIVAEAEAASEARTARKAPSYGAVAASELAKAGRERDLARGAGGRGREWGTAVHAALEAAVRGLEGDALQRACRSALVANARDVGPDGEPRELDELVALVQAMAGSELFARARGAPVCLPEVPFAWRREMEGAVQIVEGVIDLAFREDGGWVLVDWKTDEVADPAILAARREAYERQLGLYAEAWQALTGQPVSETRLEFIAYR
jgi:ATP-dependent helicase/nuclease subunit A